MCATSGHPSQPEAPDTGARTRSVIDHVFDGIIIIDEHGVITTFNVAAERIFGYAEREIIGKNVNVLMREPFHSAHQGYIENYLRTGQAKVIGIGREVEGLRKDGSTFPLDIAISMYQVGRARYFTGIVRDITQRKLAEKELRQSEDRLRELTTHIPQALWIIDVRETKVLYVSQGYEQMWGRTCQSLMDNPQAYLEGIHPLDQEMMVRANATMLQTGYIDVETRVLRPDGTVRWVWVMGYPVMDQGEIIRLVGVVEDITEKKRLAVERELLLARLQLHIERLPLAYVLFDSEFRIVDWNASAERMFGFTKAEMTGVGPPFEALVPRSFWPEGAAIRARVRAGDMHANFTNQNLTKDGRTITCEWFNTPLTDDAGAFTGMLSLAQDITERKALEAQLQQSQKVEMLGLLSGGVAHDFNNLLAVLLSCSQLLGHDSSLNDKSRQLVDDIYKAASEAASLTRKLLDFGRQSKRQQTTANLNEVVTETVRLLDHVIGDRIAIITHLHSHLWPARADAAQINQVIMNVALNARDAMPSGGTLTISTTNIEPAGTHLRPHLNLQAGPYVLLSISDTGHGMDQDTASHIFEPFFTTKESGQGTGLGLSTVFGIVKQNGGQITVHSEVGKGTTFEVYLPKDETVRSPSDDVRSSHGPLPRGTETVLLVDDDHTASKLAGRILESQGYTVLHASSGAEALLLHERFAGKIQLLVTEVVMPAMSGRELYQRTKAIQPELKVLFMSGYPDDTLVRSGLRADEPRFIEKPFTYAKLSLAVRAAIDTAD